MGSFIGIANLLAGVWFYYTAHEVKKPAITWAAIGIAVFFVCMLSSYLLIWLIQTTIGADMDTLGPSQGSAGADFQGDGLNFLGIVFELLPLILGTVGCTIVRTVFLIGGNVKDSFAFVKNIKLPKKK